MQDLVRRYMEKGLSRRGFVNAMTTLGFTAAAAEAVLQPLQASEEADETSDPGAPGTASGTGGDLCVAQMKAAGVEYYFTNPGSFEVGFFDSATDAPGVQLIMGLHEGVVISMADGYHRVSGKPAFVNVHAIAGTAQMSGQLYNAARDGSALIITAGLNDNQAWSDESTLTARPGFDQKEINRQFTKISWENRDGRSIPLMLRRAFKVAMTEPGGPVYLALAHYALEAKNVSAQILPAERFLLRNRVRPDASAVEKAAKWLAGAKNPLVIVGDEIWKSGAQAALVEFAEKFGLPVTSGVEGYRNFPTRHAQYLGNFANGSPWTQKADLILFLGARDPGGKTVPTAPEMPTGVKIIRAGLDTGAMGRNYPTDLALIGDLAAVLKDLNTALAGDAAKMKPAADARRAEIRAASAERYQRLDAAIQANSGKSPIHPDELGAVLAKTVDPGAILVSENLTGKYDSFNFGAGAKDTMWLGNTGFSLGWGLGASMGAALAAPQRPVVCAIGDGSVMYQASGFWSMARYEMPVMTVIWNNKNYQTVRHAYHAYQGKMVKSDHYAGMYLGNPDIDFVKLAESQGVAGERVTQGAGLEAALQRGVKKTRDGKPYVVEVEVARYGGGASSTWYEKFSLAEKRKQQA